MKTWKIVETKKVFSKIIVQNGMIIKITRNCIILNLYLVERGIQILKKKRVFSQIKSMEEEHKHWKLTLKN